MQLHLPAASSRRIKQVWSPSQRKALLALSIAIEIFLGTKFAVERVPISDPPHDPSARGQQIADRLDPNTADAESLAAIPNLGEKKAHEIVEFRESFPHQNVDKVAFTRGDDLLQLKGFGVGTVKNLEPYLVYGSSP